jgi:transcriptional regulator with XRE-family HTH domain
MRLARTEADLSQDTFGKRIGVAHQQIQKYETGVDRISASRLARIASAFNLSIAWFFADVETIGVGPSAEPRLKTAGATTETPTEPITSLEVLELVPSFCQISDPILRRSVAKAVKRFATLI